MTTPTTKKKSFDAFKFSIKNNVAHKIDGKKFYEYAAHPGIRWVEYEVEQAHKNGYFTRIIKKDNGWTILLIRRK